MFEKQIRKIRYLILLFFILFCKTLLIYSVDFSADMIQNSKGQKVISKVYIKKDKMRIETVEESRKNIMINDYEGRRIIMLIPESKMYFEMAFTQSDLNDPKYQKQMESEADKKYLGKEKINGYMCEKHQYTFHDSKKGKATVWYSKELNFSIKILSESDTKVETEFKNIKKGNISESLFKIPAGYRKITR